MGRSSAEKHREKRGDNRPKGADESAQLPVPHRLQYQSAVPVKGEIAGVYQLVPHLGGQKPIEKTFDLPVSQGFVKLSGSVPYAQLPAKKRLPFLFVAPELASGEITGDEGFVSGVGGDLP